MFIFKRVKSTNELEHDRYELHKRIFVKDIEHFKKVSMQYYFKKYDKVPDTLLFAKKEEIFSMNFETLEIKTLHKFSPPLLT